MKNLILLSLLILTPFILNAQTTITWKGGTPGKETAWHEARNWDQHRLPNENDHVIIQPENNGHFAQPVIDGEVQVAWVEIIRLSPKITYYSTLHRYEFCVVSSDFAK